MSLHASVSAELSSTSSSITELVELWKEFLSKANAVREKASAPDAMAIRDAPDIPAASVPATHPKIEDEGSIPSSSEVNQTIQTQSSVGTGSNNRSARHTTPDAAAEPDSNRRQTEASPCIKRTIAMRNVDRRRDGAFYLEDDICIMRCPAHLVLKGRRKGIHEISRPGEWLKKLLAKGSANTRGNCFDGARVLENLVIKGKERKPRDRSFANGGSVVVDPDPEWVKEKVYRNHKFTRSELLGAQRA
ncbi:hypothetical protein PG984_011884 [Apiospora sp. TS-2023a]